VRLPAEQIVIGVRREHRRRRRQLLHAKRRDVRAATSFRLARNAANGRPFADADGVRGAARARECRSSCRSNDVAGALRRASLALAALPRVARASASPALQVTICSDWQAATYPSETWRLDRSDGGTGSNDHNPIYRSWYSAAEANAAFPRPDRAPAAAAAPRRECRQHSARRRKASTHLCQMGEAGPRQPGP